MAQQKHIYQGSGKGHEDKTCRLFWGAIFDYGEDYIC